MARPKPFIIYANYDPGLTLNYFMVRSKFCGDLGFYMGKYDIDGFFENCCIL